jgi:hypothetical protein
MKRTFVITITIEETTAEDDSKPVEDTQSVLTAFEDWRPPQTPPRRPNIKRQPTYEEGRALHPAGAERREHTRYGTGRKIHTCSRCGAQRRRFNPNKGTCGLGELCRINDQTVIDKKEEE